MIYLIGGPPKCGKTTLAKTLSKSLGIPWVSTDTLQCVIKPYMNERDFSKKFPTSYQRGKDNDEKYSKFSSREIIEAYQQQAKTVYEAVDMFTVCEITDGNDFIIEGYHVEPELVAKLNLKYPEKIESIFLVKSDKEKFICDIKKSTTTNDWIIARTNNEETYQKIANMICEYGNFFEKESEKYDFKVLNMDNDFDNQIKEAINYLITA
ncbi:MAG: AAA family ATPase [Parcubacteria group bacterium]|jgi:2-phosphoglycerate kinase